MLQGGKLRGCQVSTCSVLLLGMVPGGVVRIHNLDLYSWSDPLQRSQDPGGFVIK